MIKALVFFCIGMLFAIGFMKLPNSEAYGAFVFMGLILWLALPDVLKK